MENPLANRIYAVGLTGGIGSGKSTVADLFAQRGAELIDTDLIAHALTTPLGLAIPYIREQFGAQYLNAEGAMDRAKMRDLVFGDHAAKKRLEAILHPLIRVATEAAALESNAPYIIFVVPLLVESGKWKERVARVLAIDCPEQTQIARVASRSGLHEAQIRAIMATQVSRDARRAAADDVIMNDGDQTALAPQVERLHAFYLAQAEKLSAQARHA